MSNNDDKYCVIKLKHNYDTESLEHSLISTHGSIDAADNFIFNSYFQYGDMIIICEIDYVPEIIACEDKLYVMYNGKLILAPDELGAEYFQCSWLDAWYGEYADSCVMMSLAEDAGIPAEKMFSAACECVNLTSKHIRRHAKECLEILTDRLNEDISSFIKPMDRVEVPRTKDGLFYEDQFAVLHAEEAVWHLSRRNFLEAVKSTGVALSESEKGETTSYQKYLDLACIIRKHISLAEVIASISS